jgi:RHS repeat-associated protein
MSEIISEISEITSEISRLWRVRAVSRAGRRAGPEPCTWTLAREFIWGARFPEPLVMVDWTAAGDVAAGSEEVLHYVRDALGSVVGLLDAGEPDATPEPVPAKLVERYDYDPYGKTYIRHWDPAAGSGSGDWVRHEPDEPSAFGNPLMWTGQRHDVAIGLYHFPFRTYSPRLGRWLQRDPLGYVDGVNMYEYVASRPLVFTDPLGKLKRDEHGELIFKEGDLGWYEHGSGQTALYQAGYLIADDGTEIAAYKWIAGDWGMMTDCHGVTFADGLYWVNDPDAMILLHHDSLELVMVGTPSDSDKDSDYEDIPWIPVKYYDKLIYYDKYGNVVHSVTVVGVDREGRITRVAGLGGVQEFITVQSVLSAWHRGEWSMFIVVRYTDKNYLYISPRLMLWLRQLLDSNRQYIEAFWKHHYEAMNRIWGPLGCPPKPLLCE